MQNKRISREEWKEETEKKSVGICPFSSFGQVLFKVAFFITAEQDRLVQYRACTDPLYFLGPWH